MIPHDHTFPVHHDAVTFLSDLVSDLEIARTRGRPVRAIDAGRLARWPAIAAAVRGHTRRPSPAVAMQEHGRGRATAVGCCSPDGHEAALAWGGRLAALAPAGAAADPDGWRAVLAAYREAVNDLMGCREPARRD